MNSPYANNIRLNKLKKHESLHRFQTNDHDNYNNELRP
jgi:hypothetical protein